MVGASSLSIFSLSRRVVNAFNRGLTMCPHLGGLGYSSAMAWWLTRGNGFIIMIRSLGVCRVQIKLGFGFRWGEELEFG